MQELIEKAKNGDSEALEEIISMYTPLVIKVAGSYYISGFTMEDLMQQGFLSIIKAVNAYEIGRNSFSSYLTNSVNNNMKALLKKEIKHKRELPNEHIGLMEKEDYSFRVEDELIATEIANQLYKSIELLDYEEGYLIIEFYFKGRRLKLIADELKMGYDKAFIVKKKALCKLKMSFRIMPF